MTITRRQFNTFAAAALAAASTNLAAQAADEVVFAATLPLTGPFAAVAKDQLEGMKDYIDFVNSKGGVRGRKVRFLIEDTQFD